MVTQATRLPTPIDNLPKAELHLHLEGTILPSTAIELAARHGVALTPQDVAARYSYTDFRGFLETFKWVTSFLRGPEDYALITRNLAEELVKQNVVYAEITISAGVMLRRTQNVEANFQAIREVAQSVPFSRLRTGWILDATRQFGHDQAMEVARLAAKLQSSGVVALGMGGDELAVPTVNFRPAFDYAHQHGLHNVCHAGEIGGPDSVREAIEMLGAERIGHGIAVMRDDALASSLATRRVVLENCITSNLCTGALAKQTGNPKATMKEHPLPHFLKLGVPVTLSTDDPGLFHTDLLREYSHAAALGLSKEQLIQLAEQSFVAAFVAPEDKRQMLVDFRAAVKSTGLV
ncbi:MAG TPA: adenosine deaminase [Candidatus Acidoferrales bacterium]|nr:adenosine deaminase [Candidatus Acidoferrales bacterium]